MRGTRIRRRLRLIRAGLAALAVIYRRDRNARGLVGQIWFTATRQGLVGLRLWLLEAVPPPPPDPALAQDRPAPSPEPALAPPDGSAPPVSYGQWLERFDLLSPSNVHLAERHLATLNLPDLLILLVVTPDSLSSLGRIVRSWQTSIHQRWHAGLLVPSCWGQAEVSKLEPTIAAGSRISLLVTPEEVKTARQRFKYTLLCMGSVLLNPLSTYVFLEAAERTGAEIVYSDHDRIDEAGQRLDPAFKPQFSPEYISHYNYIGDCLLVSRTVTLTSGDTDVLFQATVPGFDRLISRIVHGRRVEHQPFTAFHVQSERLRSVHDMPSFADTGASVAIIIPTRDGLDHLKACIDSILDKTSYDLRLVDLVVVDNNSSESATLEYLSCLTQQANTTVLKYPFAFNFAEINNLGASATDADVLVFLNNDTVVRDPAWLSKLVWYARQEDVGTVGAKLVFPDGTIQHGGCVAGGNMGTVEHLLSHADPREVAATDHTREISLVTGACVAVRRKVFNQIGGFDPVLKITWNDAKFCLQCLSAGLRNIYIADPLLTHDESKTRGQDNTRERYIRYFSEADYTRRPFRNYFHDDPSYNPNLSLEQAGQLAEPPRVRRPWSRLKDRPPRILILSVVFRIGYGVPLVIQQQVGKLSQLGYDIIIGGPQSENEFSFPGCERVPLSSAKEAAEYAFVNDVALIISHTPPFFEVPILIGPHIPVLVYDYGEPGAEFFQEPTRSYLLEVGYQKRAAAALTTSIATISQSVKDETLNRDALVFGLANSHMPAWSEVLRPHRNKVRRELGWENAFVVLTVCRIHDNERAYKGLDKAASILHEFPYLYPQQSIGLVWVLAGAGTPDDVEAAEQFGFTVFPNVSDDRLADLYKAADAYMSFSKWEGYNLGISQALAMGLPTLASDIPAHREFPIFTSNSTLAVCEWLVKEVMLRTAATTARRAIIYDWESSTTRFAAEVERLIQQSAIQPPRFGVLARPASETATLVTEDSYVTWPQDANHVV